MKRNLRDAFIRTKWLIEGGNGKSILRIILESIERIIQKQQSEKVFEKNASNLLLSNLTVIVGNLFWELMFTNMLGKHHFLNHYNK